MFCTRAHLSMEIVLSGGGGVYTVLMRECEQRSFPSSSFFLPIQGGGLPVMRHLAEAKMHQMKVCLTG